MERQPAAIIVKPINPAAASEMTGLPEDALKKHFHGSKGALSGRFTDEDLATLAAHVEGFSQVGIAPGDLEVSVGRFGRKVGERRREINDVQVIAPERWQGRVEDVRAERHRRVSAEPVDMNRMLVEQPGNPEQPSRGETRKQKAKRIASQIAQRELNAMAARHEARLRGEHKMPSMTLKAIVTMVIEMIPGGIGPWGIGDIVTAIEAAGGKTLDGIKLTMGERLIYLGASAIPVVPARPVLAGWRWLADRWDEAAYQKKLKQLPPPQQ